jgi:hypothetical protein
MCVYEKVRMRIYVCMCVYVCVYLYIPGQLSMDCQIFIQWGMTWSYTLTLTPSGVVVVPSLVGRRPTRRRRDCPALMREVASRSGVRVWRRVVVEEGE